jgi:Xaa-Pro aminopeptidase
LGFPNRVVFNEWGTSRPCLLPPAAVKSKPPALRVVVDPDKEDRMVLSSRERSRRYDHIKKQMVDRGLDAIIVCNSAQITEKGFVKYVTSYRSVLYNLFVIFPLNGNPKLLVPSPVQEYWGKRLGWISDVEINLRRSESLVGSLETMGLARGKIGIVSLKILPADIYSALIEKYPDTEFVEAAEIIENARMVKSTEEQELVRQAASIADESFSVLAEYCKPGISEREIIGEVDRVLIAKGAEDIFHLFSSDPESLFTYMPSDRKIQTGDTVIMNTELSGPEGYWVQMIRTCFVGQPKKQKEKMYNDLMAIRADLNHLLYPGKPLAEVADIVRTSIMNKGYQAGVNFGHCMGLDVVERPQVHINEKEKLRAGMVITVHPQLVSNEYQATVWMGDTYLITDNGPETLTKTDPLAIKILS